MGTHVRPVSATAPLSAADRCDRCGAQAFVRATLPGGGDLLFCGHHAHELRGPLRDAGATLHDETASLTTSRASSAAA